MEIVAQYYVGMKKKPGVLKKVKAKLLKWRESVNKKLVKKIKGKPRAKRIKR